MTAVLGILNKQAVAIAADSAVTIGGHQNHKIFNRANKVFTLSKHQPVGIMIYNSASFMATPWETIIKIYRKQLGEKIFPTVVDYQNDFIKFLHSKHFFTDTEIQKVYLGNFSVNIINSVINEIVQKNRALFDNPNEDNKKEFLKLLEQQIDQLIHIWESRTDICPEFIDYSFDMFRSYSENIFSDLVQTRFTQNAIEIPVRLLKKIKETVFLILKAQENLSNYTGLIFTGFGEEEIYPQLVPVNISMVTDNRLRYYIDKEHVANISNSNNGAVRPFAQTDVIDTILSGIDPSLDNTYLTNFHALFNKYNDLLISIIGNRSPDLSSQ
ncbi:MAG: hypothetical protein KJ607_02535, partial [Bacteroidetes bacterium]|nr:hypothetical protein [Bacteroidota bacterium]